MVAWAAVWGAIPIKVVAMGLVMDLAMVMASRCPITMVITTVGDCLLPVCIASTILDREIHVSLSVLFGSV